MSDCYDKNIEQVMYETNDNAYGGCYSYLNDCSLSETQTSCKDVVIDGNFSQEVTSVECPITSYDKISQNNTVRVLGKFNMCHEGGSFISKETLRPLIPQTLKFIKMCVSINPGVKHTKFDSPICSLMSSTVAEIACRSRRDSGHRLLHRCVHYVTDAKYAPKQLSHLTIFNVSGRNHG